MTAQAAIAGDASLPSPSLARATGERSQAPLPTPFAAFGDEASYALVGDGGFENGGAGWSFAGGAHAGRGHETRRLDGSSDRASLALPQGSSATSPSFCVGLTYPTTRFFTRSPNGGVGRLRIDAIWHLPDGTPHSLPIAYILPHSTEWAPSPALLMLVNAIAAGSSSGLTNLALRFTAESGDWQVDDVYVDPFKSP